MFVIVRDGFTQGSLLQQLVQVVRFLGKVRHEFRIHVTKNCKLLQPGPIHRAFGGDDGVLRLIIHL